MTQFVTSATSTQSPQFEIGPASIDDFSTIRHVHALAIQRILAASLSADDVNQLCAHVRTADYTAQLMSREFLVAKVNGSTVGTIAWSPVQDGAGVARISAHFVHPLYVGIGIGRALLEAAVEQAATAGYPKCMARVPLAAISLYENSGFATMSQGVAKDLAPSVTMHVAFMRRG